MIILKLYCNTIYKQNFNNFILKQLSVRDIYSIYIFKKILFK